VLFALMEYAKLTLPVLFYVLLEAFHHKGGSFIIASPEWGIATVFLAIHGPGLCEDEVERCDYGVSKLRMRFFRSAALLLAGAALLNSFLSFDHESTLKVILRVALFCFASIAFILVVGAARHLSLRTAVASRLGGHKDHAIEALAG
jgi:hypothetical protein